MLRLLTLDSESEPLSSWERRRDREGVVLPGVEETELRRLVAAAERAMSVAAWTSCDSGR